MHQTSSTAHAELQDHPIAAIFPLLPEQELESLAQDVKIRGVEIPIVLYEGKILDGRNRYRAAMRVGAHFTTNYYTGDSPVEYVLSLNLHRRHLSPSQSAAVAVESLPFFAAEAKKRQQIHGGTAPGKTLTANLQEVNGTAAAHAAQSVGVSERLVAQAKAVKRDNPELYEEIRRGEITVNAASKPHVVNNSGNVEWYTPPNILELAREVMGGIDLDPASCEFANKAVQAKQFFTEAEDGIKKTWKGRVWLNPPYEAGLADAFTSKLLAEIQIGVTEAICLTNNATETAWGSSLLAAANAVCFPKGRIRFLTEAGVMNSPLQGQMICYLGKNVEKFSRVYGQLGPIKR
jgi:ParB family chromosome partitioning protein